MSIEKPSEPSRFAQLIVHGRDIEQRTVYSWSRDGHMHSTRAGDGQEIPVDATEIKVKRIDFPHGCVREIYLAKSARTHPHGSYEDVLFYQIGGRRVQMCKEHCSGEINPGDASFEPAGVEHSTYQLIGGLFIEFAFPAPPRPDEEATWIRAVAAESVAVAEWVEGNETKRAFGNAVATAPRWASRYTARTFALPGYPLVETTLPKGAVARTTDASDQLLYVVSGKMEVVIGDVRDEVVAGDSMRSVAGQSCVFSAIEDSVYVQTAVPSRRV